MIGAGTRRTAATAAVLLLAACSGSRNGVGPAAEPLRPSATTVVSCEPTIAAPAGFRPTKTSSVPLATHTGVRRSYVDPQGRLLHISAGIAGEFAEGADLIRTLDLASGRQARLYGAGGVWILVWREDGVCGDMAVIGDGFTQDAFVSLLTDIGVV